MEFAMTKFDAAGVTQRGHTEKSLRETKRRVLQASDQEVSHAIKERLQRTDKMTALNAAVVDGWHAGVKELVFANCTCQPDMPNVQAHRGYLYGHLWDAAHYPMRPVLYVVRGDSNVEFWSYVAELCRSRVELVDPVPAKAGLFEEMCWQVQKKYNLAQSLSRALFFSAVKAQLEKNKLQTEAELEENKLQTEAQLEKNKWQAQAQLEKNKLQTVELRMEFAMTKFDAAGVTQRGHTEKSLRETKRRVLQASDQEVSHAIKERLQRTDKMTALNAAVVDGWHAGVKELVFANCTCQPDMPNVQAHRGYLYGHLWDAAHYPMRPVLYVVRGDSNVEFWSYVAELCRSRVELVDPVPAKAGLFEEMCWQVQKKMVRQSRSISLQSSFFFSAVPFLSAETGAVHTWLNDHYSRQIDLYLVHSSYLRFCFV